jgi:hypothetical protein
MFDQWLSQARTVGRDEDDILVIGMHSIVAREWLDQRPKKLITQVVSRKASQFVQGLALGHGVGVRFILHPDLEPLPVLST